MTHARRGFVLIAVLWIVIGLSAAAMTVALLARESVNATQNRLALSRAEWGARDCLARTQVAIAQGMAANEADPVQASTWMTLDRVVATSPIVTAGNCKIEVRARARPLDADSLGVAAPDSGIDTAALSLLLGEGSAGPGGWVLTISRTVGMSPPVTATLEEHLVLAGNRVATVRQRTWP